MSAAEKTPLTIADYVEIETRTGQRHAFLHGEVFAMAGGTPEHNAIAANLTSELGNLFRDSPCQIFNSDQKIKVEATGLYTYSDVSVVCDKLSMDAEEQNAICNPTILVEVLSKSTEDYDRGGKWTQYRTIPSLQQYILVDQYQRHAEWYVRTDDHWELHEAKTSIPRPNGKELSLDEVYLKVQLKGDSN